MRITRAPIALTLACTTVLCAAPLRPAAAFAAHARVPGAASERVDASGGLLWTHKSQEEIKWFQLTDVGTLVVGTDAGLASMDPDSGVERWRRDDLPKVTEDNAQEIAGTPLLLVSTNAGFVNKTTQLLALDKLTGKTVWSTDKLKGETAGVVPIFERNMVIIATTMNGAKGGPTLTALKMSSGELVWESSFPNKVDLYPVERGSRFFPHFDLSGYQQPVYDGESIYFTWAGLHRFDAATGKLVWAVPYDVTEGSIKRGNAQIVVDGDVIYTSAKGQIRAIDKAAGTVKWTSKDYGGAVAQMLVSGGTLYGRLGGSFYDSGARAWALKKPLGVVALDKATGAAQWQYDKAKDSVTNMLLLPEQHTILLADAESLIGLDTQSSGKISETFKVKLEFKNRLGASAKVAKAAKIATGGLRGLMSKGPETRDFPVALHAREDGMVVVQGKQHVLAFDPSSRAIPWSVQYDAPGVAGWQNIVMAAITVVSYLQATSQAASTRLGTSENDWANDQRLDVLKNYEQFAAKRFTATKAGERYVYVLTQVADDDDKGPGVVGIDLTTGEGDRSVLLKDKEPDYEVDERAGRLFNLRDKHELTAYTLR